MKITKSIFASVIAFCGIGLVQAAEQPYDDVVKRVVPVPQQIVVNNPVGVPILKDMVIEITSPMSEKEVISFVAPILQRNWHLTATIKCVSGGKDIAKDGYTVKTDAKGWQIAASDKDGLRNALNSLRQLAEPERGVAMGNGFIMPEVQINDYPRMAFRGFHYTHANSKDTWKIERIIRLCSYFKFNYMVLETDIPLKSHPEYNFRENKLTQDEIRRLVKLGKELGVTVIPGLQVYGHIGQGGIGSGKHVILDKHPEYAPLFEPTGWTLCISNPAARKYMEDIVLEVFELFGRPPYFHLGGDEAYNAGSCSLCRGDGYWKKVAEHFAYFNELLKARGCRSIMWHDMLFAADDPAWKGSTANGTLKSSIELRKNLPKDIIIDYWEYRFADHEYRAPKDGVPGFPIVDVLRKEGFDVLCSGWQYDTTPALGEKARDTGCLGIMQTTWGTIKNTHDCHTMFALGSISGWNPGAPYPQVTKERVFTVDILNRFIRDVNQDMGITSPSDTATTGL